MFRCARRTLVAIATLWSVVAAHTVIVYPGWRGNNLHQNGTTPSGEVPTGALGMNWDKETETYNFPYGQQWMYPCGGMPTSTNRTRWPIHGGALSFQPGWFPGHANALVYINMGVGTEPLNMSLNMVPPFQIVGPSNEYYNGTVCLPQVPLPKGLEPKVGDHATIQVIETAQHGAALYSCVDIIFDEPQNVAEVNETNCFNSTEAGENIEFNLVFATTS
ncbi:hypothetical protein P152DRAFT_381979, partial [Eremomyces bilateralis CBS 781.70]